MAEAVILTKFIADAGDLKNTMGRLEGKSGTMGSQFAVLGKKIAAAFAAKKVIDFAVKISKVANAVENLSIRTGFSTDQVQTLTNMMGDAGMSFGTAEAALRSLDSSQRQAIEGNEKQTAAFNALGISVASLRDKNPADIFNTLSEHMSRSNLTAEEHNALMTLMGGRADQLVRVFQQTGRTLEEETSRQTRNMQLMSKEAVEIWSQAWQRGTEVIRGLIATVAEIAVIVRTVNQGLGQFAFWLTQSREQLDLAAEGARILGKQKRELAEASAVAAEEARAMAEAEKEAEEATRAAARTAASMAEHWARVFDNRSEAFLTAYKKQVELSEDLIELEARGLKTRWETYEKHLARLEARFEEHHDAGLMTALKAHAAYDDLMEGYYTAAEEKEQQRLQKAHLEAEKLAEQARVEETRARAAITQARIELKTATLELERDLAKTHDDYMFRLSTEAEQIDTLDEKLETLRKRHLELTAARDGLKEGSGEYYTTTGRILTLEKEILDIQIQRDGIQKSLDEAAKREADAKEKAAKADRDILQRGITVDLPKMNERELNAWADFLKKVDGIISKVDISLALPRQMMSLRDAQMWVAFFKDIAQVMPGLANQKDGFAIDVKLPNLPKSALEAWAGFFNALKRQQADFDIKVDLPSMNTRDMQAWVNFFNALESGRKFEIDMAPKAEKMLERVEGIFKGDMPWEDAHKNGAWRVVFENISEKLGQLVQMKGIVWR